jgi:hypothetical protein
VWQDGYGSAGSADSWYGSAGSADGFTDQELSEEQEQQQAQDEEFSEQYRGGRMDTQVAFTVIMEVLESLPGEWVHAEPLRYKKGPRLHQCAQFGLHFARDSRFRFEWRTINTSSGSKRKLVKMMMLAPDATAL